MKHNNTIFLIVLGDFSHPLIHVAIESLIRQKLAIKILPVCADLIELEKSCLESFPQFLIAIPNLSLADIRKINGFYQGNYLFLLKENNLIHEKTYPLFSEREPDRLIEMIRDSLDLLNQIKSSIFTISASAKYVEARKFADEIEINKNKEVLELLCQGYSIPSIAKILKLKDNAVRNKLYKLRDILCVNDLNELIVCAFRSGLVD